MSFLGFLKDFTGFSYISRDFMRLVKDFIGILRNFTFLTVFEGSTLDFMGFYGILNRFHEVCEGFSIDFMGFFTNPFGSHWIV